MITEATGALELFYSYAHKDEKLRNELNKHLYNLKRQKFIVEWYDRDISAGTDWEQAINTQERTHLCLECTLSAKPTFYWSRRNPSAAP